MNIKLSNPYKVVAPKVKRYQSHYEMPADRSLIVPIKFLGDEVSCDIRWEDENGELHLLQNKIFVSNNLVPVDSFSDTKLLELWQHYYGVREKQN